MNDIRGSLPNNVNIIKYLFEEKNDLLIMILKIVAYNNIDFSKEFFYLLTVKLCNKVTKNDKLKDFLDILCALVTINDNCVFERLYNVLGYPNIIIKNIPRKRKTYNNSYYYNDSDSDGNSKENEKENEDPEKPRPNWPLFGERLINGDINKQIYEYIGLNHRKKTLCLLGLLFPNDNENEVKKEYNNCDDDEDEHKVIISNELKKNVIMKLFENMFGNNNYSLFKYIYLSPARTIIYKNLYEEMSSFVKQVDNTIYLDKFDIKAEKYIKNIEKEINDTIKKAKNEETMFNTLVDSDNEEEESSQKEFKSLDENMKYFIGFNSDIIPGEIVREEIVQIAQTRTMAMFRIQYFTKYYKR